MTTAYSHATLARMSRTPPSVEIVARLDFNKLDARRRRRILEILLAILDRAAQLEVPDSPALQATSTAARRPPSRHRR